jgi:FtsH-binding integral membrane protein
MYEKGFYLIASAQVPVIIIGQFNLVPAALIEVILLIVIAHFSSQAPNPQSRNAITLILVTALLAITFATSLHVYIPLAAMTLPIVIATFLICLSEYRIKKSIRSESIK